MTVQAAPYRLVLVTGPSGAGRSTALHTFEDLGYETIDNLPFSLVPRLFAEGISGPPMALGLDTRNREFSAVAMFDLIAQLRARADLTVEVLYLDCASDVLVRRYSETRRRHPLAPAESPSDGIARELDILGTVKPLADCLIDTSDLTIHDLKAEVKRLYSREEGPQLAVSVHSFSYKRGVPRGADMVFDCRFLRNPYWQPDLRPLNGQDPRVTTYVGEDPRFGPFFDKVLDLTLLLLPAYLEEGKSHLSIAFGCTGGQHRSVTVAEKLCVALADAGWRVSKRHRELERQATQSGAHQMGKTA